MKKFYILLLVFLSFTITSFAVVNFTDDFNGETGKKLDATWNMDKVSGALVQSGNWDIIDSWDNSPFDAIFNGKGQLELILTDTYNPWATSSLQKVLGSGNFEVVVDIANITFYDDSGIQNISLGVWDMKPMEWESPDNSGIMFDLSYNKDNADGEKYKLKFTCRKNGTVDHEPVAELPLQKIEFPIKFKLTWDEKSKVFTTYYGFGGQDAAAKLGTTSGYLSESAKKRWMNLTVQHAEGKGLKTSLLLDKVQITGEDKPVDTATATPQQPPQISGRGGTAAVSATNGPNTTHYEDEAEMETETEAVIESETKTEIAAKEESVAVNETELKEEEPIRVVQNEWLAYKEGLKEVKSQNQGLVLFKHSKIESSAELQSILDSPKISGLCEDVVLIEVDAKNEGKIIDKYSVFKIPAIFVINKKENVEDKWFLKKEDINEDVIYDHLKTMLKK